MGRREISKARELEAWLRSERVEQLSATGTWPSEETADMWNAFRASFIPPANRTWTRSSIRVEASWQQSRPMPGSAVHLVDDPVADSSLVLSPDLELIGALRRRLNAQRCGLTLATIGDGNHVDVTYLGPDRLFAD
jgi:hypothetical protein